MPTLPSKRLVGGARVSSQHPAKSGLQGGAPRREVAGEDRRRDGVVRRCHDVRRPGRPQGELPRRQQRDEVRDVGRAGLLPRALRESLHHVWMFTARTALGRSQQPGRPFCAAGAFFLAGRDQCSVNAETAWIAAMQAQGLAALAALQQTSDDAQHLRHSLSLSGSAIVGSAASLAMEPCVAITIHRELRDFTPRADDGSHERLASRASQITGGR
jgi:hypothetical protein